MRIYSLATNHVVWTAITNNEQKLTNNGCHKTQTRPSNILGNHKFDHQDHLRPVAKLLKTNTVNEISNRITLIGLPFHRLFWMLMVVFRTNYTMCWNPSWSWSVSRWACLGGTTYFLISLPKNLEPISNICTYIKTGTQTVYQRDAL